MQHRQNDAGPETASLTMHAGENDRVCGLFRTLDDLASFVPKTALRLDDVMVLMKVGNVGSVTAGMLVEDLGLGRARISRCLERLERASLVHESVQRTDYRMLQYRLSNRGENLVFEIRKQKGKTEVAQALADYCALQRAAREAERCFGMRKISDSSLRIFLVLCALQHSASINELSDRASYAHNRISQAVTVLESAGFVQSVRLETDERVRIVSLTSEGEAVASMLFEAIS